MKTAKALGLDVPTSILLSADELSNRNTATQEDWIADGGNGSKLRHSAATVATADHLMSCLPFTPLAALRRLTSN